MSDFYLELRSRIAVVAEKTHVGAARLQEAQRAVGLSNEAIARKIPVSEKTWRRWKADGTIPTAVLPAVAVALRLELHEIVPDGERNVSPAGAAEAEDIRELRVLVDALLVDRGLDPQQILRDAEMQPRGPAQEAGGLPVPGEAAEAV